MSTAWAAYFLPNYRLVCIECLPAPRGAARPVPQEELGDFDAPTLCSSCGRALDVGLTPEGVEAVLARVVDWLRRGRRVWDTDLEGQGFYKDQRKIELARDLALMVLDGYDLPTWVRQLLSYFLGATALPRHVPQTPVRLRRRILPMPPELLRALCGLPPVRPAEKRFDRYGERRDSRKPRPRDDDIDDAIFDEPEGPAPFFPNGAW